MLHQSLAKIKQVSQFLIGQAQISKKLLLMGVIEPFDALKFDDDLIFDQEVYPKTFVKFETFVLNGNSDLSVDGQSPASKLMRQDNLIDRLQ